jgi:DNA gyrase subunit A
MRVTIGAAAQLEENDEADVETDDEDGSDSALISRIVSLVVVPETGEVLCACANGYGKRTPVGEFPTKKRGGKGVIAIKTSERNGELVGAVSIDESKELMLISDGGTMVRTRASEVATTGRNAQGVRLIRLGNEELLVGVVSVEAVEEDEFIEAVEGEEVATSEALIDSEILLDDETIADEADTESDLRDSDD